VIPAPSTRSTTVFDTNTSPAAAVAATRAARWTAIPPTSSPRCSISPDAGSMRQSSHRTCRTAAPGLGCALGGSRSVGHE
jgi:hypothetical protein